MPSILISSDNSVRRLGLDGGSESVSVARFTRVRGLFAAGPEDCWSRRLGGIERKFNFEERKYFAKNMKRRKRDEELDEGR